jgi:ATPase subunit of ABC transporter with duplicated ATPase domains
MRLLAGLERPERGSVKRSPPDLRAGYLPQELGAVPGETLVAHLARRTGVAGAADEMDRLAEGDDLEARAEAVCAGLGLGGRLHRPLDALSGGQAARARLAALLLTRFDVLCLDEPTNDLASTDSSVWSGSSGNCPGA